MALPTINSDTYDYDICHVRTGLHALLTLQKDVIPQDIHEVHSPHVTNVYVVVESDPTNTR